PAIRILRMASLRAEGLPPDRASLVMLIIRATIDTTIIRPYTSWISQAPESRSVARCPSEAILRLCTAVFNLTHLALRQTIVEKRRPYALHALPAEHRVRVQPLHREIDVDSIEDILSRSQIHFGKVLLQLFAAAEPALHHIADMGHNIIAV